MAILVTGGAGYIGSHTVVELQNAGLDVVVVDNLVNSSKASLKRVEKITGKSVKFYECDINDVAGMNNIFDNEDRSRAYIDGIYTTNLSSNILVMSATFGDPDTILTYLNRITNRSFVLFEQKERATELVFNQNGIPILTCINCKLNRWIV